MRLSDKLRARVHVCEGSDTQAVRRMELRLQEITACLTHIHQLQKTGSWKQNLNEHTHTHTQSSRDKSTIWRGFVVLSTLFFFFPSTQLSLCFVIKALRSINSDTVIPCQICVQCNSVKLRFFFSLLNRALLSLCASFSGLCIAHFSHPASFPDVRVAHCCQTVLHFQSFA